MALTPSSVKSSHVEPELFQQEAGTDPAAAQRRDNAAAQRRDNARRQKPSRLESGGFQKYL